MLLFMGLIREVLTRLDYFIIISFIEKTTVHHTKLGFFLLLSIMYDLFRFYTGKPVICRG